jgi:hypothetical protein
MVRRRSTVRFREGARSTTASRRRSSEAEQAAHNRRVGGSSPPAATRIRAAPPVSGSARGAGPLNPRASCTEEVPGGVLMTQRFCPLCATEVQDVGGYCRLGHRLRLDPPQASLGELRDEVERAFGEAEVVRQDALVGATTGRGRVAPPSSGQAPPRAPRPATPGAGPRPRHASPAAADPITAFAPPPRMDWGPERPWRRRLERIAAPWRTRRG